MTAAPADLLEIEMAGYSVELISGGWRLRRMYFGRMTPVGDFDTREQALAAARDRIDQGE